MVEKIPGAVEEKSCDAVFVAGDITNFGTVEEAERILGIIAESDRPVFFVAGNCDPPALLNHRPMSERVAALSRGTLVWGIARQGSFIRYEVWGLSSVSSQ